MREEVPKARCYYDEQEDPPEPTDPAALRLDFDFRHSCLPARPQHVRRGRVVQRRSQLSVLGEKGLARGRGTECASPLALCQSMLTSTRLSDARANFSRGV